MFDILSRFNPLRRIKSFRNIEAMEQDLRRKERANSALEHTIKERTSVIEKNAIELQRTAEEAFIGFDGFRGKANEA